MQVKGDKAGQLFFHYGDVQRVEEIQEVPAREVETARLPNVTRGVAYSVNCTVQARQRAIIKARGLLNFPKTGGTG